jgi:hypothetical protein
MASAVLSAGPVPGELAARIAAGPAFWTDWLDELDRDGLLEELPGPEAIGRALAEAPGSGRYDSALNSKMTLVCMLAGCLFPGEGYDRVLARAFAIPGLRFWPWPVPAASALSQARERLGEHAVRRLFGIGAEAGEAELGLSALWHATARRWNWTAMTCWPANSAPLPRPAARCCGSSGTSGRPAAAGSPLRSAPITRARTSSRTGSSGPCGARWSTSPRVPVDGTVSRGGRNRR